MNFCPYPAALVNRAVINCKSDRGGGIMIGVATSLGAPGLFAGGPPRYRFKDCPDGTSKTFLIGETLPIYNGFHMYFASHMNVASTNPPINYHRIDTSCPKTPTARPPGDCYAQMSGFKSNHPGGAVISTADGGVHFVPDTIDYLVYQFFGNKADGQTTISLN